MIHPLLTKSRILFTVNNCRFCILYSFIEHINAQLKWDKRIKVINCTKFHDFGIIDEPIITLFNKYLQGAYPVLFWEGEMIQGANTEEEIMAYIQAKANEDFEFDNHNQYLFNKECRFQKLSKFKKETVVCT